ncbi:MAG: MCE family protein [Selenomonadaceae bacterium]|nr:MCE family protein [Selenomonadaceae bacterium]
MNPAAKVGAFTVGGVMALGATTLSLGNFDFNKDDYTIYAGFKQVIGLEPQAAVRLAGVPIGKVTSIKNDGGGVTVTMDIESSAKIPDKSSVMVAASGVMGEKFVSIMPSNDTGVYLQNGDYLYGVDEVGMDSMFESLNKVMDKVDTLLISMNNIVGDPTMQKSLIEMSSNMKDAAEHMNGLMNSLESMAKNNEGNVNQMMSQLNSTLNSLNNSMSNLEKFAGDPQTVDDLKSTLANIKSTTDNIAHIAENMDSTFGDKKTADNLKDTIQNAKNISERADKMLGKVDGAVSKLSSTKVTPSISELYSGDDHDWNTNFNINLKNDDLNVDVGVEDIGDGNKLNLQVGKFLNSKVNARAGVINGKPGVGLDTYLNKNVKLSAEAFDPNDGSLRLKSQFKINNSTYLLGEIHNVTDSDDRAAYFGLKKEF